MANLAEMIAQANEDEIGQLLLAVIQRYSALFPDWEISTFSIDKTGNRNDQIDRAIRVLETLKTSLA